MYYLYILRCADNSLYTGITDNVSRRFKEHQDKKGGRYTRSHPVRKVVYIEKFQTKSQALKRESHIKTWRRQKKIELINKTL
ncbi:MAG: hypothetical protein COV41_00965 [Candidatus Brennerbacteria bacterium CG11_big_fil_rev_8_21_14_0_20_43_10]|uniref:GIY-YIG domain-containing protein n=2 Tax=Candidatus Brenneribacteriota TaxID=1817902 RepID=A0A2H9N4M5_9BACT|nr:MAG: hypothetical protein COX12_01050 [Candidatus Brennerbacteria bacterium CG23_combo_of_CG06-09_8_20_14_all_44_41]PIR26585.1 MAG: hypothetical protein COV41_00965 [Candidatus Brennerbacteria bacterium CG11_big_fil_rev_8_21_14_0_20_43_10]PIX28854.1 MAG: hypothetical protein COZ64_01770 [Candidatus Brennerbacteria bacterium CG_4_8_14_3_um_filter_43_14]PJA19582.1 MAG: hypothetical protein COX61_00790 [Candidatus Brennerbacteria bacterium CG_4_10_14_0_2_um_filter_43_14]